MSDPRNYFFMWAGSILSVIAVAALINFLVDPYLLFFSKRVEGLNAVKATYQKRERMAKAHLIGRSKPRTIILGNSRSQRGFDPDSEAWPSNAQPVLNISLPGGTIYEIYRYLQHGLNESDLRTAIVGLEFEEFLVAARPKSHPRYQGRYQEMEQRLSVRSDGKPNDRESIETFYDYISSLISLDTFIDSVITVAKQHSKFSADITPSGFNPLREGKAYISAKGQHFWFEQKYPALVQNLGSRKGSHAGRIRFAQTEAGFYLEKLIELAREHGIAIYLVIPPYHVKYLEVVYRLGLAEDYWNWQQYVVDRIAANGMSENVRLWDFSGFHDYNNEAIPAPHDKDAYMTWHDELGHYRPSLGNLVLQRIFGSVESGASAFGTRLTAENIRNHTRQGRAAMRKFFR